MAMMLRETALEAGDSSQMMGGSETAMVPFGVTGTAMNATTQNNTLLPSKNINGTMPSDGAMPALMQAQQNDEINEMNMNP